MFVSVVKATEVITSDVGSWSSNYGFQTCYGYGGAKPCVSNGTYFSGDGIGSGDVVFAYSASYYIYQTFSMPAGFSGNTMYLSLDLMTGPRNSEQGNKTEYVVITIQQKNSSGVVIQTNTIYENITNTTMQTYDYTVPKNTDTSSVYIQISGQDGGYWAGNYGAVIGAGSITLNDGAGSGPVTSTTTGTSLGPTTSQSTTVTNAKIRRDSYSGDDNGIYIDQAGNNNSITILQDSDNNQIRGIDQQYAKMWGNYNTYDIRQGAPTTTGINLIELMVDGDSNSLTLFQDRFDNGTPDSSASGDNILRIDIDGNSNTIATNQRGETNRGGQFGEINITGDLNDVTMVQRSTLSETAFIDITGNSNVVDLLQQNTSNAVGSTKFADIKLTGDGHTVNLTQDGTGGHQATIDLIYGSAPSTLNLNQLGSTSQTFSLEQTCYTSGGCSTTLTQQ